MSDPAPSHSGPLGRPGRWLAFALPALLLAGPARAQAPRTWMPPADSLRIWSLSARVAFEANRGDSLGGSNLVPYEIVGRAARRMLRGMGPSNLLQAPAIVPVLDSLGFDVDVAVDPGQPTFAMVMVRNPYRFTAHAMGFLYWSRAEDFRMQGLEFRGGMDPAMRVWFTGKRGGPYECAVLDRERGAGATHFTLFRLSPGGDVWTLGQDDEHDGILGTPGTAVFADLNSDGIPEIVHWAIARTDSLFVPCTDCPKLTYENLYVDRSAGFVLEDSRLLATGYAAFVTFVRLLIDRNRTGAALLVRDPADVTKAIAEGWSVAKKPGTWHIEAIEEGERWPRWMEARFAGPQGVKRYIVHFGLREGKWIVESWTEPKPVSRTPASKPAPRPPRPTRG